MLFSVAAGGILRYDVEEGGVQMMDIRKGIVNHGNPFRLKRAVARAQTGKNLTVAFIGGSITQGSLASSGEACYAHRVFQWFSQQYGNVRYINAGIGGTTSQFAAARVDEDVLRHHPDIVFVEFSVNDACTAHFQETYEGLVRRLLAFGAAVVLIHNICYDTGNSAESIHLEIGKYYDLPCVSVKPVMYDAACRGEIPARDITPDDLHPNDAGHMLLANLVVGLLEQVLSLPNCAEQPIPVPLTANHYENSCRYQNHNLHAHSTGFVPDHTPQEHITQMFRRGFIGRNAGDSIRFSVTGTCLAVQYRKSVRHPAPVAVAILDGDEENPIILDANFQETWGDCLYLDTILEHAPLRERTVEIRILEAHKDDAVPFYLVSLISASPVE